MIAETCSHDVQFYESDESLGESVAEFIRAGLARGEPAIIVATQSHRELFARRLADKNCDVEAACADGRLTILDAHETLARLSVGARPDADLFRNVVGGAMASITRRGQAVVKARAYGEMVDILWRAGNHQAALDLEAMWNELAGVHSFDLLCAYSMGGFYKAPGGETLREVCDLHAQVIPPSAANGPCEDQVGTGVRALVAEIGHRRDVEQALRVSLAEQAALAADRARLYEAEKEAREAQGRVVEELRETVHLNELFVGVLAHDLRSPLAAMVMASGLLKSRERTSREPRNEKVLDRMLSSGHRMTRMIEQLLDFTRLRVGGGLTLAPADADLGALIHQMVDEIEDAHPEWAIEVEQVGDALGLWDVDRLGQVFSNLLGNAVQHGRAEGGIKVRIEASAPGAVRVHVHNEGVIPAELIPRVFDPMVGGEGHRDRTRGLGLGLFITRQIARAHGGDVSVVSSAEEGTTFTLSLPRGPDRVVANPALELQARRPEGKDRLVAGAVPRQVGGDTDPGERRLRLLVDGVKDYAIFMLDPQGHVVTWNEGARRTKGYDDREIIGQHFSRFHDAENVAPGRYEHELAMAAAAGRFEDEGWRVRKDGSRFWANVVITPLHSPSGELLGFTNVTRDVTERRRFQEEQIRCARADEAIRLRDEFLTLASHELKTPLTILQMELQTLHERLDATDHKVTRKLHRATQSSERLTSLVESLLDVSRISAGKLALDLQELDLTDAMSALVDALRPVARKAGCQLSFESDGPSVGTWDRLRLEQAMTNLATNAAKYGAGRPVAISLRHVGNEVVMEVRDHGPGIPAGDLGRIFGRFERAGSIRNHGGLGLGLYVIQEIVAAHGGTVSARNAEGGGACFQIRLPAGATASVSDDVEAEARAAVN